MGNGNDGGDIGERLARIEAKMENVATKTDLADLKTDIAKADASRSKWLITVVVAVVIALASASILVATTICDCQLALDNVAMR